MLWAWDADPDFEELAGEQWLILLPHKWNPTTHRTVYSWHYDPRALGATAAPERRLSGSFTAAETAGLLTPRTTATASADVVTQLMMTTEHARHRDHR